MKAGLDSIGGIINTSQGNADDRGEVLALSYMAAKGFLYFASDDSLPLNLIRSQKIQNPSVPVSSSSKSSSFKK